MRSTSTIATSGVLAAVRAALRSALIGRRAPTVASSSSSNSSRTVS